MSHNITVESGKSVRLTTAGKYCDQDIIVTAASSETVKPPVIAPLSVTENGTYTPPSGVDGYAPVEVNVASSGGTGENRLAMFMSDTLTEVTAADFGSATIVPQYLFSFKKNLESVVIPNSVKSIEYYAFYECYNLTNITIPSSVTSIGVDAFNNCTGLTSIVIPSGVKNITSSLFKGCKNLHTIVLRGGSLVSMSSNNAFQGTPFYTNGTGGTCYVPQALIESYKTATNWSALYEAGTCNFVAIEGSEYE